MCALFYFKTCMPAANKPWQTFASMVCNALVRGGGEGKSCLRKEIIQNRYSLVCLFMMFEKDGEGKMMTRERERERFPQKLCGEQEETLMRCYKDFQWWVVLIIGCIECIP